MMFLENKATYTWDAARPLCGPLVADPRCWSTTKALQFNTFLTLNHTKNTIEVTKGFRRRFPSLETTGCVISGPVILLLSTGMVNGARARGFCQAFKIGRRKLELQFCFLFIRWHFCQWERNLFIALWQHRSPKLEIWASASIGIAA